MNINFKEVVIKDLKGEETKVDISKVLANVMYNTAVSKEAANIAKHLNETGEIEVNVELADQIKVIVANNFLAIVQFAVDDLLSPVYQNENVETIEPEVVNENN